MSVEYGRRDSRDNGTIIKTNTAMTRATRTFLPPLYKKIIDNGWLHNGSMSGVTHLDTRGVRGGKIRVPDCDRNGFLSSLAEDICAGEKLYINEAISPVFNMYMDLDLKYTNPEVMSDASVSLYAKISCAAVKSFYDPHEYEAESAVAANPSELYLSGIADMTALDRHAYDPSAKSRWAHSHIILVTQPSEKGTTADGTPVYKCGVHIVFRNVAVNTEQALRICHATGSLLERYLPSEGFLAPNCTWDGVIDRGVYANGLRMPYMHKATICTKCKNTKIKGLADKPTTVRRASVSTPILEADESPSAPEMAVVMPNEVCAECCGEGKVYGTATYEPFSMVLGDGSFDPTFESAGVLEVLHAGQIRRDLGEEPRAGFRIAPGAPIPSQDQLYARPSARPGYDKKRAESGSKRVIKASAIEVKRGCVRATEVQRFLRGAFSRRYPAYRDVVVDTLYATGPSMPAYIAHITGHGHRFCYNIGADHNSKEIYFVIKPEGCVQKCTCKCPGHAGGVSQEPCSKFSSHPVPIPATLKILLFGYPDHCTRWAEATRNAIESFEARISSHDTPIPVASVLSAMMVGYQAMIDSRRSPHDLSKSWDEYVDTDCDVGRLEDQYLYGPESVALPSLISLSEGTTDPEDGGFAMFVYDAPRIKSEDSIVSEDSNASSDTDHAYWNPSPVKRFSTAPVIIKRERRSVQASRQTSVTATRSYAPNLATIDPTLILDDSPSIFHQISKNRTVDTPPVQDSRKRKIVDVDDSSVLSASLKRATLCGPSKRAIPKDVIDLDD